NPQIPRGADVISRIVAAEKGFLGELASSVRGAIGSMIAEAAAAGHAAGGWVGGDIVAGAVRAGFSRPPEAMSLYVDLGTNGEIVLGGADFALACACSAGPAFEGGGIRCGMRADRGAVDGASINAETGAVQLSVIGGGRLRGVCGSGLIALTDALFRAGWIDRGGQFTDRVPAGRRAEGKWGAALALSEDGKVALWERD